MLELTFNFDPIVKKPLVVPVDNKKVVMRLLKRVGSLSYTEERIYTEVSGNWTHRRQQFANNAQRKKDKIRKDIAALTKLAELWEKNECPEILKHVRSESDFDAYYPNPPDDDCPVGGWYREEYPAKLKKATRLGINSKEDERLFLAAIKELSEIVLSPEEIKKRELDKAIVALRGSNIPGFFPTPDKVIDVMLEHARLEEYDSILEPSAGIGSIIDRIIERYPETSFHITCVERQYSLVNILKMKGYPVVEDDIFEYNAPTNDKGIICSFDKILMNPPFENKQDVKHVMHCFNNFLKPGGRLVSVMSTGTKSNSDNLSLEFMEFVGINGYVVDLGQLFKGKDAFRNTGVYTILVILEKV